MNYFVTAIGTDSGKTLVSAILCEALQADYWKPVQAGFPTDSDTVRNLVSNPVSVVHPEGFCLKLPASPHAAAKTEGAHIKKQDFKLPATNNSLVIEGAGGLMVPLNDHDLMIDLISYFNTEAILVSNLYLGNINHSLLSIEALKKRNIPLKGIVFNGEPNQESESIILQYAEAPCLLRILPEDKVDKDTVIRYASGIDRSDW